MAKTFSQTEADSAELAYVNGEFCTASEASISIFDRGFLFADGVYEVSAVVGGRLVDNDRHLARLARSLAELDLDVPWSMADIGNVQRTLIAHNNLQEGTIYLQITRGAAVRDFAYPKDSTPTLVMFTRAMRIIDNPSAASGIDVITIEEIRWKRRDIKSVALLAQAMGKQQAMLAGAQEAWMVEDGYVTEGTSSNAYIVDDAGCIITRPATQAILRGITREAVLALVEEQNLTLEERPFSPHEAYAAKEAFITSASSFVLPVVKLDGRPIGDGRPGPITRRLREIYIDFARRQP